MEGSGQEDNPTVGLVHGSLLMEFHRVLRCPHKKAETVVPGEPLVITKKITAHRNTEPLSRHL